MTRKSSNQSNDIPLPPGHMRFGLTIWKDTPLVVKLAYLETQKTIQEMEGVVHQLRDQRDRLREVGQKLIRHGVTRSEANFAFVSQEEHRLIARCARLRRAHRIERRDAKVWRKTAQVLANDKQRMLKVAFNLFQDIGEARNLVRELDLCLARKLTAEQTANLRRHVKALPWLQEKKR